MKFDFALKSDYYIYKEHKKGIKWYVQFIGKLVQLHDLSLFFENSSFLRTQKVLKFESNSSW